MDVPCKRCLRLRSLVWRQVVMAYAFLTAVLLGAFWAAPNVAWMQWAIVAAVGFALYGPQMLIGLCGAEVVRKPAVSAAQGFLGWISYLGAHLRSLHPCLDGRGPNGPQLG
jgi:sugar phosphate permease